MIKKFSTFTILLFSQFALAQVTITSSDIMGILGSTQVTESDTTENVQVDLGSSGANQTWDFTTVPTQIEHETHFIDPAGTPFENQFPDANFVQLLDISSGDTIQQFYMYASVLPSQFLQMGEGTVLNIPGEIDTSYYMMDNEEIALPFTYGTQWTHSTADTTDYGSVIMINERNTQSHIDAWGDVQVPAGTYACLRLREDITEISSTWSGGVQLYADTSHYIDYTWISKTGFVVCSIESQDGETNPNYTQAAYFNRLKSNVTAIAEESGRQAPERFRLDQNYPNPFNPQTTISYSLLEAGQVQITIYNSAGELVSTLVNEFKSAGNHAIQWNAQGLASGVYYYKISSAGSSAIRKSILLK